jgi:hypothetical protein
MTEDQIKDATKGVMSQRRNQSMTKIAKDDKRFGDEKYCKRVEIDHAKDQMRDDRSDREVWEYGQEEA